jgi:hypothetical protein
MSDGTFESRVAVLENRVGGIEKIVESIDSNYESLYQTVHGIDKKLDIMLSKGTCPNPGMCLSLSPRIDSLEISRAQAVASWKTFSFLGGAIIGLSATIGGIVSWIVSHANKLKA